MEVFLAKGANGICNSFMTSLSRQISLNLRGGVPIEAVVDQLKSTPTCPSYSVRTATKKDTSKGSSCPSAIAFIIEKMQKEVLYELGINEDEIFDINIKPVAKSEIKSIAKPKTEKDLFLIEYGEIPYAMKYKECPQCGSGLHQSEGCYSCLECGWTKC
jgi:ribonucleoside-diphosphate reductase alpha chain